MPKPASARRCFAALAAVLLLPAAHAADWAPTPFHATYSVQWKGFNAGTSTLDLQRTGADTWRYDSRNLARGLFRIAIPDAVTQTSELRFANGRPQPLTFRGDDGSDSTARDVSLDFDWQRRRVTGTAENRPVDLAIPPDVQDPMSIQLAQMHAAATGATPVRFPAVDKDRIKEYEFTRTGAEKLKTALGEFDTLVFESRRRGSSRVIRLWMAPALDYLPVRAERRKGDKPEFAMAIRELQRG